ncbi:MAG: type IV toxin-antitoxin system AbiEi family antitoxin domain-containing protein [Polyangiaceae bacterium]|nr:type IV toxin-antitoxin system AbiEi family antitoxin domain-containing protein [Polyangiaceae bacterium]
MNAREALGRLRRLRVPAATTSDAAAVLGLSVEAASHTLRRLAASGLVTPVRRGLWALSDQADPLALAEYVTAPYPSYVSLQTALYRRGMIGQIPSSIYLVSLARSDLVETGVGTYSVHHVRPELFGGFEHDPQSGTKLASPEKALFDFFYLSPTRGRLFVALPELELPRGFRRSAVREWVDRIPSARSRTIVTRKLESVLRRR